MLQIKNTLGGGKPEGLYVWKKCENDAGHTFLDYIVSDKETAYPDGGEKGGYWYEKLNVNIVSGTITFSAGGNTDEYTIEHGLGVIPKYCAVFKSNNNVVGSNYYTLVYIDSLGSGGGKTVKPSASGTLAGLFVYNSSKHAKLIMDENTITIPKVYSSSSPTASLVYKTGTYEWIAITI